MQIQNTSVANPSSRKQRGFTLIEMIGVLAVIAILASLLVPKVFGAIRDAQINGTALSVATIKTAVVDHYGKYNTLSQWSSNNTLVNLTFSGGVAPTWMAFFFKRACSTNHSPRKSPQVRAFRSPPTAALRVWATSLMVSI
jgi:prepilin-type N-terminal cleavage/methylation domain-containing protein